MLDSSIVEKKCNEEPSWNIKASSTARNCRNYIREVVDGLNLQPNPEKPVIALSIGLSHFTHFFFFFYYKNNKFYKMTFYFCDVKYLHLYFKF